MHASFGGVVPEVASRAHLELINPIVQQALSKAGVSGGTVNAVAATIGPGLMGSLLVGVSAAKALALVWGVPFIGINHLEAHLYACFLEDSSLEFPLAVLLVSGGHTILVLMEDYSRYRVLGQTLDDAAGEAFDKVSRFLGLGYPGGPAIEKAAADGDDEAIVFPRAMLHEGYNFSFSGIKTSVVRYVRAHPKVENRDVAACFQKSVVDVLITKATKAAEEFDVKGLCLAGGVAANSLLRKRVEEECARMGIKSLIPSRIMCTDNAAMVACTAWWRIQHDQAAPFLDIEKTVLATPVDPGLTLPV